MKQWHWNSDFWLQRKFVKQQYVDDVFAGGVRQTFVINLYSVDPRNEAMMEPFLAMRRIAKGDYGNILKDMDFASLDKLGRYASYQEYFRAWVAVGILPNGETMPMGYTFGFDICQDFLTSGYEDIVPAQEADKFSSLFPGDKRMILLDGVWVPPTYRKTGIGSLMIETRFNEYNPFIKDCCETDLSGIYGLYSDTTEMMMLPLNMYTNQGISFCHLKGDPKSDRVFGFNRELPSEHFEYIQPIK